MLQHPVLGGDGRVLARIDLAWAEVQVAIELDSFRWHGARRAHRDTARRRNRLEAQGWRVLVATSQDEDDRGVELAATVGAVLAGCA